MCQPQGTYVHDDGTKEVKWCTELFPSNVEWSAAVVNFVGTRFSADSGVCLCVLRLHMQTATSGLIHALAMQNVCLHT